MEHDMLKKLIEPFAVEINLETGEMPGAANHLVRKASDMKGYYADEKALIKLIEIEKDPVHYEVFEVPVPEQYGHLMYCISKLQPGRVGNEFFMTKGHYHNVIHTSEIYLCLAGEGFMLMKTSEGRCEAVEMKRNQMVYVPPLWAHRSVNTGSTPLISFCVYNAEAGHNYGDIVIQGFPKRIFLEEGKIRIK